MSEFPSLKKTKRKKIKFSPAFSGIEPQEIFLDSLSQKKEKELGLPERRFEVLLSRKILKILFFFILVIIFVFFARTFQIQIIEHNKYSALAEENKFVYSQTQASRGVIYDSKGKQLVFNNPSFDLIFDKKNFPFSDSEREKILKEISKIINQDINNLKTKIASEQNQIVLVSENLDHQTLILLETKINNLPGFEIRQNSIRHYKDGPTFSRPIGYTGRINSNELEENPEFYSNYDYVGRDGLEKSYEEFLRKNPGKIQIEKDARGNLMSKKIVSLPESGKSLVLWLDSELQKKAEETLKKTLERTGAKKGVAIALNPNNGGVLALVSIPSFDNNLFSKGADQKALENLLTDSQQPLFNHAISGLYSTGSTIKPLVASAALEEKIISPSKKIDCKGKIIIPNRYNPEESTVKNDWTTHGWTDIRKAIAESCNVYFYTVGGGYKEQIGLGPSRIKKYLELFGWGSKTGIDIPAEAQGSIPSPEWKKEVKCESWWDGDTYNLAIGQGDILITPIQVATSFVAIANGGTLYSPKIVKQIIDSDKNTVNPVRDSEDRDKLKKESISNGVKEISPDIIRNNFIDPQNLKIVREGMRQAVSGENSPLASSVILNSLPVAAAAKTGTAETPIANHYHNWVTVFAPYDDPQIVLTVMVEGIEGLQSAALPTAKEILNWYFSEDKQ